MLVEFVALTAVLGVLAFQIPPVIPRYFVQGFRQEFCWTLIQFFLDFAKLWPEVGFGSLLVVYPKDVSESSLALFGVQQETYPEKRAVFPESAAIVRFRSTAEPEIQYGFG